MASITYYGHVTVTYQDYIDVATGKTLVCQPGQTYDVIPASGRPNAAGTTQPNDGRFTLGHVRDMEAPGNELKEPDKLVPADKQARRGVAKQDTSTPEVKEN